MLFNSYIFLFLFLPLCLGGYYLLAHFGKAKPAKLCLTGFSLWFYGYFNPSYLLIMLFSILFNYGIFRLLISARKKNRMSGIAGSRFWMTIGVLSNLGILFYFKYYDFFIENVNAVFDTSFMLKGILLPLGISFFTFQQIGFVVDSYRGEIESCSFLDYSLFVSFFPQLIAGPIVNHNEMMPQFEQIGHRQMDWNQFTSGVYLFTLGMVKKVLVADTFGKAVNWGYSNVSGLTGVDSALLILFYVLQLYFDFHGYSTMAVGPGQMLGLSLPKNFAHPYAAKSMTDFWRRWHITLSSWFRDYVYIPLGGSRRGRPRQICNLLAVWVLLSQNCTFNSTFWVYLAICFALLAIALTDLASMLIPGGLIAALAVPVLGSLLLPQSPGLPSRLIGLFCVSVPMLLITLAIPGSFGGGDIKLVAVCGFLLGWQRTLLGLFLALLSGGAYGSYLLIKDRRNKSRHFAFGPFLCGGAFLALLYGQDLINWYIGLVTGW